MNEVNLEFKHICRRQMFIRLLQINRKGVINLNETIKTIMDRRSVRQFTYKPIDASELEAILEAGKYAPSAVN